MQLAGLTPNSSPLNLAARPKEAASVVEIGILLPTNRAEDLVLMAKSRQESVGHLIRKLIERELSTTL